MKISIDVLGPRIVGPLALALMMLSASQAAAQTALAAPPTVTIGKVGANTVADRLAIAEVLNAFAYFYDTGQWEKFTDLLAPDARIDSHLPGGAGPSWNGRDAIILALKQVREGSSSLQEQPYHLTSGIVFRSLTTDRAQTVSYLNLSFSHLDQPSDLRLLETYVSDFYKQNGQWRLARISIYVGNKMPPAE